MSDMNLLGWDQDGLIPVVVQHADTGEVLTLAYMNRDSLARTRELGQSVFFSRSRKEIWHKGATSGNYQDVVGLAADCDGDALVLRVRPRGPACHTGARSCFFQPVDGFLFADGENIGTILNELEQLIADRRANRPEGSYTTQLFERGTRRIMQKVGEEAVETVIAGTSGDREEMTREASDLIFHLLVALKALDIPLSDIARELRSRRK